MRRFERKVYLNSEEYTTLHKKASKRGFTGRGWLSSFIRALCTEDFVIISPDTKKLLQLFALEPKK